MSGRTLPMIALCGKMRSGKDTVADYLVSKYGYERFAFGDELKRYYHNIFGQSSAGKDRAGKQREAYQWFGQTMRGRDEDVWVRKCFESIDDYYWYWHYGDNEFKPVITDVRQPNELARCREEGYVIIKVDADEKTRLERIKAMGDDFNIEDLRHETELFIDDIDADYTINNSTGVSVDELHAQVDGIMREITKGERY